MDKNQTLIYAFGYSSYCDDSYITDNETNLTTFDSSSYEDILHKVSIAICSIIFPLGIIGNGLVIWIAGFRMKRIWATWYLNLAIADLLCCAFFPVYITGWKSDGPCSSYVSDIICSVDIILMNLSLCTSVLLLTAMSIDRCFSVMWILWIFHKTRNLVRITAGIIWVLSLIWTGIMYFLLTNYISHIFDRCNTELTIHLIRLVIMFVIPFFIIFTSYFTIFLKIRKSNSPQRSQRPYRIITAVILCFFICWAPYYIWPTTPMYYIHDVQFQIINTVVISLACLNSCINPIIYVFMSQDLRHSFLRSIPFRIERAIDDPPDDPHEKQEDPEPPVLLQKLNPS